MKKISGKEVATFKYEITPSDECFAFWYLWLNINIEKAEMDKIKNISDEELKGEKRKSKGGKHQSHEYFFLYHEMYQNLDTHQDNPKAW